MTLFRLTISITKDGNEIKKEIKGGFESRGSANFYGHGWVDCYFKENSIDMENEIYGYIFGAEEYEEND